jgi:hypothetical protein
VFIGLSSYQPILRKIQEKLLAMLKKEKRSRSALWVFNLCQRPPTFAKGYGETEGDGGKKPNFPPN